MHTICDINPNTMTVELIPGDFRKVYKSGVIKRLMDFASEKLGSAKLPPLTFDVQVMAADYLNAYGFEGRVVQFAQDAGWPRTFEIDKDFPEVSEEPQDQSCLDDLLESYTDFYRECLLLQIKIHGYLTAETLYFPALPKNSMTREIVRCLASGLQDETTRRRIDEYMYQIRGNERVTALSKLRDEHMAGEIENIWNSTEGDVMHVGGMSHIFGNYHNLYERLKARGLNPVRRKLREFGDYFKTPLGA